MKEQTRKGGLSLPGSKKEFLRFQLNLISLEKGCYDVLQDDQWVAGLAKYLIDLYKGGYFDFTHRTLTILGDCTICEKREYREKSLFVLSLFIDEVIAEGNEHLLQALSWIFLRWMRHEPQMLGCYEHVCSQLGKVLRRLLEQGRFCHATLWLNLVYSISSGQLERVASIRAVVTRLHRTLLGVLLEHDLNIDEIREQEKYEEIECLFRYFNEDGAVALVQELYGSPDKERRLALISTLTKLDDSVADVLLSELGDDKTWYKVRNAVHIIGHYANPGQFKLLRPLIEHPDRRVQQEIRAFAAKMSGARTLEQHLGNFKLASDEEKIALIPVIAREKDKRAEVVLVELLEQRHLIDSAVSEELLLALCRELRRFPSMRVSKSLQQFIEEREGGDSGNVDPVTAVAKETVAFFCSL